MGRPKKLKTPVLAETGMHVDVLEYRSVTRARDPEDAWSGENTDTLWTVNGISIDDGVTDVSACFPVADGDLVYLLYVVYSTGDSYSHNESGCIFHVDVFKTKEIAAQAAIQIREHADGYRGGKCTDTYSLEVIRENGTFQTIHTSWNGYFESISYIEVKQLTVGSGAQRF